MKDNILLCGNPNVGKSSIFNELTNSNEHTGNWTGKTVELAKKQIKNTNFTLIDLPGIYSLSSLSEDENIAKNTLLFDKYEKIIYVMDSSNIEKNMNLLLQVTQINKNIILCLNMTDELESKGIEIKYEKLSKILGIKVIKTSASNKEGIKELKNSLNDNNKSDFEFKYDNYIEEHIENLIKLLPKKFKNRYIALKILERDSDLINKIKELYNVNIMSKKINNYLLNINSENISDDISIKINEICKKISKEVITYKKDKKISNIDKLFSSKIYTISIMLLIIFSIFLITIALANYPSEALSYIFTKIETILYNISQHLNIPKIIYDPLIFGVYRIVTFVISVMFPPLVIFFFLYTYAEESGIMPRIAFNLDRACKCASCHGKQALTICSGFGCNACAVVGSRIIDSKRDKLLAILTNSFIPCNGRFPMIIAIITMFFVNSNNKLLVAMYLTIFVIFAIAISFITSYILSKTILKGYPGFFILELPDYKKVKIKKIIKLSFIHKSLSILKKAIVVSIPAGIIIWLFTNTTIGELTIFNILSNKLNPIGKIIGLDGIILLSFILALPANEIVLPIIIMGYLNNNNVTLISDYLSIKNILINNGWTITTAISTILFSIMHFPCATTLSTIKSEVGTKWMIYAFIIPLITGIIFLTILNVFI